MKQAWSKEEIAKLASDITDEKINENIEANPELEGDEDTLSSIGIKGVNYAVGGGSEVHLYRHLLRFEDDTYIEIYTSSSTPLTMTLLKENYQGRYFANRQFTITSLTNTIVARYVTIEISSVKVSYWNIDLSTSTMALNNGTLSYNPVDTITQIF